MIHRGLGSGVRSAALCAAFVSVPVAAPSCAEEPFPEKAKPWYQSIGLGLFAETIYTYNFNRPSSSKNQLRVFDTEAEALRLDVVEIVLQKKAGKPGELGFRIDAIGGSSLPHVTAATGLFRDEVTGEAKDFDLLQAFVTYVAPLGRGLTVDAGKFTTHIGYEVVEGPDSTNDNVSRSLLFGWTNPVTHTGIRVTYPISDTFSAQAIVALGWDVVKDNNDSRSFGAQLIYAPTPRVKMALNAMIGPEKLDNDRDQRRAYDAWISWTAGKRLLIAANADYGDEQGSGPDRRLARWYGLAVYARVTVDARFALSVRGETFDDPDGVRTGTSQTLQELTFTPEWKIGKGFVLRGDLRRDWSNEKVFERRNGVDKEQTTASLSVLFSY